MTDEAARLAVLESIVSGLETEVKELRDDRKHVLKWGLIALGTVVSGLVAFIVKMLQAT